MSDWKRVTKEVPFDGLPSEMVTAVKEHIEQYNLGSIPSDALLCVQTDSEKIKKGLFGGAETVRMGVLVTPRWLLWVFNGTKIQTTVLSAQLIHVTIRDYAQTQFAKMLPDAGIEVSGIFTGASESASAFIGLDEGMAAQRFKEVMIQAAADAKK